MSPLFRQEVEKYGLAFTCETCVNFRGDGAQGEDDAGFKPGEDALANCAMRYPTAPHRQSAVDELIDGEQIFFCKMFEAE